LIVLIYLPTLPPPSIPCHPADASDPVIDLDASPPGVVDQIVVGDGPAGLAGLIDPEPH